MTDLSTLDVTLECGSSALTTFVLFGGLKYPTNSVGRIAPGDLDTQTQGTWEKHPVHLPSAKYRKPGDLIGEIITKTLSDDAPNATSHSIITAADDCKYIRHIEGIIPICYNATVEAIGWDGARGKTSEITSLDGSTKNVRCLVLGR